MIGLNNYFFGVLAVFGELGGIIVKFRERNYFVIVMVIINITVVIVVSVSWFFEG